MFEKKPEHFPDRPLECGECKKPIAVRYTEIVGGIITHTSMCADCPELERRLHGKTSDERVGAQIEGVTGVVCGHCGTTLDEVRRGHRLGCMECYTIFGDLLIKELLASNHIPARLAHQKTLPVHIGRVPGESQAINPSSRLLALNEALKETLSREDYEQAAWLRDQIKALTEEKEKDERQK